MAIGFLVVMAILIVGSVLVHDIDSSRKQNVMQLSGSFFLVINSPEEVGLAMRSKQGGKLISAVPGVVKGISENDEYILCAIENSDVKFAAIEKNVDRLTVYRTEEEIGGCIK